MVDSAGPELLAHGQLVLPQDRSAVRAGLLRGAARARVYSRSPAGPGQSRFLRGVCLVVREPALHADAPRGHRGAPVGPTTPRPRPWASTTRQTPGEWQSLGTYNLAPGAFLRVKSVLSGSVVADAFRFVYRGEKASAEAAPTPLPAGFLVTQQPAVARAADERRRPRGAPRRHQLLLPTDDDDTDAGHVRRLHDVPAGGLQRHPRRHPGNRRVRSASR